jgi:diacylglycerol kinase family enzyme
MRADLVYNAYAGRRVVRRDLEGVTEYLARNGWAVTVHETHGPQEATALARRAAVRGADVVIAAGGDGTVNEVVNGLVGTDAALGVLPVGTSNVWAMQMGIPMLSPMGPASGLARLVADLEERMDRPPLVNYYRSVLLDAARVLVEGQTCAVDVGQANDRHFLLWTGIGLDAEVTIRVSPEDKKAFGPWAFVGSTLDIVREYKNTDARLVLDGQVREVRTSLIVVSNIQLYGGRLPIGARACVDDGKLDVCVFKGEGLLNYVQHVFRIAARQHLDDPHIEYDQCAEIVIESSPPLPVHVDDEPFDRTPVSIHVAPKALRAIVPQDVPPTLFCDERRSAEQVGRSSATSRSRRANRLWCGL